jgi:hypothetical protein
MLAQAANSTSFQVPIKSQSLTSFFPTWEGKTEEMKAWISGRMDSNQDAAGKTALFLVFLIVLNAGWIWGCKGLEVGREWWEEWERRERFREWMGEERRGRREGAALVGILRREGEKRVKKRVSWELDRPGNGEADARADLERKRSQSGRAEVMFEEVKCEEIVLDIDLPSSCLSETLEVQAI